MLNRIKQIILLLAFFFFVGCKTSKVEKLEIRTDSTVAIKTTEQRPPLLDNLTIYDICDTVQPVKFKKEFIIKNDTITVEVVDNDLVMSLKLAEQIISKQDSIIKINDSQISEIKTVTQYKTPKWAWATIGLLALFVIFPIIPKFINTTFRKLISWI
jgi:hypothetical protein